MSQNNILPFLPTTGNWGTADDYGANAQNGFNNHYDMTQFFNQPPSMRSDNILSNPSLNPARECDSLWKPVNPGDHIVMKCKAKASLSGGQTSWNAWVAKNYPNFAGRLGFDYYGIVNGAATGISSCYQDNNNPNFPPAYATNMVAWGSDWVDLVLDVVVPAIVNTDGGWGAAGQPATPTGVIFWVDAERANSGTVWFSDMDIEINPTSSGGGGGGGGSGGTGAPVVQQLSANPTLGGTVTSSPAPLSSQMGGYVTYPAGSTITLTANPATNYLFKDWTIQILNGATVNATGNPLSYVVGAQAILTANFQQGTPPPPPPPQPTSGWILTALGYDETTIDMFRRFGHAVLPQNLIDLYHDNGADIAKLITTHPELAEFAKRQIDRLNAILKTMNF